MSGEEVPLLQNYEANTKHCQNYTPAQAERNCGGSLSKATAQEATEIRERGIKLITALGRT